VLLSSRHVRGVVSQFPQVGFDDEDECVDDARMATDRGESKA
jgi:hypothetical protein